VPTLAAELSSEESGPRRGYRMGHQVYTWVSLVAVM
jgi:hypothetical protein